MNRLITEDQLKEVTALILDAKNYFALRNLGEPADLIQRGLIAVDITLRNLPSAPSTDAKKQEGDTRFSGPWVKWDGGECPLPPETMVITQMRCETEPNDRQEPDPARIWNWLHDSKHRHADLVAYRIVQQNGGVK